MKRTTILFLAAGLFVAAWAEPAQAQRYRGRWGGGRYWPSYGGYYDNYGSGYNLPNYYGFRYNYPGMYSYGYSYPQYYGYSSSAYPSYSYSYPNYYYNTTPYSGNTNVAPSTGNITYNPDQTSTSFYGNAEMTGNQVRVRVILPDPNARLWVENQMNQFMGTERIIMSPPLDPNGSYSYTMKATWMANGQEVTREKKIDVRPGQEFVVNFNEQS